jgi:hypothetical protein
MPPAGFEPAIPASELTQTHALNLAATRISTVVIYLQAQPIPEAPKGMEPMLEPSENLSLLIERIYYAAGNCSLYN